MWLFLTISFLILALIANVESKSSEMVKSLADENTDITLFNFVGSYGYFAAPSNKTWNHLCVVSILNDKVVMLAAHCLRDHNPTRQILLGQSNLNAEDWSPYRDVIDISEVIMNPKYNNVSAYYDIGKIYTAKKIIFNKAIQPIKLYDQPFETNIFSAQSREYGIVGWGQDSNPNSQLPLKFSHLWPISSEHCNKLYGVYGPGNAAQKREKFLPNLVTSETICAGSSIQNLGSCTGDSGTPLFEYIHDKNPPIFVARGVLHGCIVDVDGCCGKDYPPVFGNLYNSKIWNFITNNVTGIRMVSMPKTNGADIWKFFLYWLITPVGLCLFGGIIIGIYKLVNLLREKLERVKSNDNGILSNANDQSPGNSDQPLLEVAQTLNDGPSSSTNEVETSFIRKSKEHQEKVEHYINKGIYRPLSRVATVAEINESGQKIEIIYECCGGTECDASVSKHQDNFSEENILQNSTETCQLLDETATNIAYLKPCRSKSLPHLLPEDRESTCIKNGLKSDEKSNNEKRAKFDGPEICELCKEHAYMTQRKNADGKAWHKHCQRCDECKWC